MYRVVRGTLLQIPLCLLVAAIAVIGAEFALAIDGNYASPYASQYDSRSTAVMISDEAWVGIFLLLVNGLLAVFYALRHRWRQRQPAN